MVSAAQAIHWFEASLCAEAQRVPLSAACSLSCENNRDRQRVRWLAAYERFLEDDSPGYSRSYRDFDLEQELTTENGF